MSRKPILFISSILGVYCGILLSILFVTSGQTSTLTGPEKNTILLICCGLSIPAGAILGAFLGVIFFLIKEWWLK